MSGKTLSNSTLSLRFMQNAQRAKQQAEIELEKAKIKDEAEWEVSKEVQEAWGITSKPATEQPVTYEASYLPFLFPSSRGDLSSEQNVAGPSQLRISGRRTFGKGGKELSNESKTEEKPEARDAFPDSHRPATLSTPVPSLPESKPQNKGTPTSSGKQSLRTSQLSRKAKPTVSALSSITDTSVGVDLRSARKSSSNAASLASTGIAAGEQVKKSNFLRPVGVDFPVTPGSTKTTKRKRADSSAEFTSKESQMRTLDTCGTGAAVPTPDVGGTATNRTGETPAQLEAKKVKKCGSSSA